VNGDKVSFNKDGSSVEIGSGAALPADWPSVVPAPAGSVAQGVARSASQTVPGKFDFFAMFDKSGDCAAVMQGYKNSLAGWSVVNEMAVDTTMTAQYTAPDGTATVSLGCTKNGDTSQTSVAWNNMVPPPK
jgi:hypothetical protein